jgi:hypothetical protein
MRGRALAPPLLLPLLPLHPRLLYHAHPLFANRKQ